MSRTVVEPPDHAMRWRKLNEKGKPVGSWSIWHLRFNGSPSNPGDVWTCCGFPQRLRKDGAYARWGDLDKGGNRLEVISIDDLPMEKLCKLCFPPLPKPDPNRPLFEFDEREDAVLIGGEHPYPERER